MKRIFCDENMTAYPEFTCGKSAVFGVVYTRSDEKSKVRYCCTAHAGKTLKYVTDHKHPVHRKVTVVHLEKDIV